MNLNQSVQADPNKEDKHKSLIFLLFLAGISLAAIALLLVLSYVKENEDIRSHASPHNNAVDPQMVLFMQLEYKKDEEKDYHLEIKDAKIRNGFVTSQSKGILGEQFNAILLDKKNKPVLSNIFILPTVVSIDAREISANTNHGGVREVEANSYGVTIPYDPTASFIKILNSKGQIVSFAKIDKIDKENNFIDLKPTPAAEYENNNQQSFNLIKPILASNGTFNIAIIGDNYKGNTQLFNKDVSDLARGLISIEPFASNKANIVFYSQLAATKICNSVSAWPSIQCDDAISTKEASSIPYDKIYVLYNGPYTGYAYVGGALSYGSSAVGDNLVVKQGLFIHEMGGHSLGALMDEYSYQTTGIAYGLNCSSSASCPAWVGVNGLGCFQTCGYTNLFRATAKSSVMNMAYFGGILSFDSYSTQLVQNKLSYYVIRQPVVTSKLVIPSELPSPTSILISPFSTITPSPTLIFPTITTYIPISPVPSPTSTPVLILTISPSITINASFPTPTSTPTIPQPTLTPQYLTPPIVTITVSPTITVRNQSISGVPAATIAPTVYNAVSSVSLSPICTFPNYCTLDKYCGDRKIQLSCGGTGMVCCTPQAEFSSVITTPTGNQSGPTPTQVPVQRFVPFPTISSNSGNQSPTPTKGGIMSPSPIATITISGSTNYNYPTPTSSLFINFDSLAQSTLTTPSVFPSVNEIIESPVPTVTLTNNREWVTYPTITPFSFENIKRDEPTPNSYSFSLTNPMSFITDLIKNILNLIFKKD